MPMLQFTQMLCLLALLKELMMFCIFSSHINAMTFGSPTVVGQVSGFVCMQDQNSLTAVEGFHQYCLRKCQRKFHSSYYHQETTEVDL